MVLHYLVVLEVISVVILVVEVVKEVMVVLHQPFCSNIIK